MIEVIRYGTKKVIDCAKCGCRFSYDDEDIRLDADPQETLQHYYNPKDKCYVICPQCENEIDVTFPRDMKR